MPEWLHRDVDVVSLWNGWGRLFAAWFMVASTQVNFGYAFVTLRRSKLLA